jgi:hypothetical protein
MFSDPFLYGKKIERRDALEKVNNSWGNPPEADKAGTGVRSLQDGTACGDRSRIP